MHHHNVEKSGSLLITLVSAQWRRSYIKVSVREMYIPVTEGNKVDSIKGAKYILKIGLG